MDYQRFLEQLPSLYEDWGKESIHPKSSRFQSALSQVQGMTTANIMQLLNFAVACMEEGEIYCEVGTYHGATLIGAMLDCEDRMAYAVDNFSLFDPDGTNFDTLSRNLVNFGLEDRVFFCNQDFESFLLELDEIGTEDKIGVYLYDGAHDYRSQLMGLLLIKPFLADRALIIVDDANWPTVQQANNDFVATHSECQFLLELLTPGDGYPTFWDGIHVLSWDRNKTIKKSADKILQRRQSSVIQGITDLQQIEKSEILSRSAITRDRNITNLGEADTASNCDRNLGLNSHSNAEIYNNLGINLAQQHKLDEAIANFRHAISIEPNFAEAHYNLGFALTEQGNVEQAIVSYHQAIAIKPDYLDAYLNLGAILITAQQPDQAITYLNSAIEADPNCAEAYLNLGNAFSQLGKVEESIANYQKAIALSPGYAQAYNNLGSTHAQNNDLEEAIAYFEKAIEIEPEYTDAYCNLGDIFFRLNRLEEASFYLQQALDINPNFAHAYANLGAVLMQQDKLEDAISHLQRSLQIAPHLVESYYNLAIIFVKQDRLLEASSCYQKVIQISSRYTEAYFGLGNVLSKLNKIDEAIDCYQTLVEIDPDLAEAHTNLGDAFQQAGQIAEAMLCYQKALIIQPNNPHALRMEHLALPIVYDCEAEINHWREHFTVGLRTFCQKISEQICSNSAWALQSISSGGNFHLGYQGKNDRDLQSQYGQLVHHVMAANYPDWVQMRSNSMSSVTRNGKIRVGYISTFFRSHTVSKLTMGWLRHANRQEFEIYCYHVGRIADATTAQISQYSDRFYHIPDNLEAACQQVLADNLDIIVFTDVGMNPMMTQMAALRLAPVQCKGWGHPITTGLPTVDYFLSSDAMELPNAQAHYSEKLIRIPKLGYSYAKPTIPKLTKTRDDFQLEENAVVYLCCQSLQKYLPQYDYVFAEIALRVTAAQFVFIASESKYINTKFAKRLDQAFANLGLQSEQYCVFVPHQNWHNYLNLNLVSDIFLDSIGWSGGNTALEAIACGLPIVTYPGELMRSRHAYAFLQVMGISDTIAQNGTEYVEISAKLGLDSTWRQEILSKMQERLDLLYDDYTCVQGLEGFYKSVIFIGLDILRDDDVHNESKCF